MKFQIPTAVTRTVGRTVLQTQKHSPTILFGAGVVGVVATVVLACRATLKLDDMLDNMEKDREQLNTLEHSDKYTETDVLKDKAFFYTRSTMEITKLYAPAVGVGVLSIGCLTGAHVVLNRRNVALTAAYAAIEKGYNAYRERVIAEYGEDKDRELRFGTVEKTEKIVGKDGKTREVTTKMVDPNGYSIYSRFFDELCPDFQRNPEYNLIFLKCQQNYANERLQARGHLFLNEVYESLGIPHSRAGAVVGWFIGKDSGDCYVDFGVFNGDNPRAREFVNGHESAIRLDFNVDGVIYDKI